MPFCSVTLLYFVGHEYKTEEEEERTIEHEVKMLSEGKDTKE